jgi:hypothetical protein
MRIQKYTVIIDVILQIERGEVARVKRMPLVPFSRNTITLNFLLGCPFTFYRVRSVLNKLPLKIIKIHIIILKVYGGRSRALALGDPTILPE